MNYELNTSSCENNDESKNMDLCRENILKFVQENDSLSGSKPFFIKRFFFWILSFFSSTITTVYDLEELININLRIGS